MLPDEGFTFKLSDDREVSVRYTEVEGKTEVQVIFDAENENPHELQAQGWQTILDQYKKYTEANWFLFKLGDPAIWFPHVTSLK